MVVELERTNRATYLPWLLLICMSVCSFRSAQAQGNFTIAGVQGEPLVTFTVEGDVVLHRGVLVENAQEVNLTAQQDSSEFILQGETQVLVRVDPVTGNMYLRGTATPVVSIALTAESELVVKDSDGVAVARFDHLGNLQTLGTVLYARVTTGLQVLYEFKNVDGTLVKDTSGEGEPYNLLVDTPSAVTWPAGGGLSVNAPTLIGPAAMPGPARIGQALKASNAITVEAWVQPASATHIAPGPGRLVTLSASPYLRNFSLGQLNGDFEFRLRTTRTESQYLQLNGLPASKMAGASTMTQLQHVVVTRAQDGAVAWYLNGAVKSSSDSELEGDFSSWSNSYALALASEFDTGRPWTGTYRLLALYNRALTAAEVLRNFRAGNEVTLPTASFSATPRSGARPLTVSFTDTSTAGTAAITSWQWDFDGNGTIDSTSQHPTYAYQTAGQYDVILTVQSNLGRDARTEPDYITVAGTPPTANFNASPLSGSIPLTVTFTDTSQPGSSPITTWEWDFNNDGQIDSVAPNPVFTYSLPGQYSVRLKVTSAAGTDDELKAGHVTALSTTGRFYVNKSATGNRTGSSWTNAFLTIGAALDAAEARPGTEEIWVALGRYEELLILPSNVKLYGGFAGTETEAAGRAAWSNTTTVGGGLYGVTMFVEQVQNVVIDSFTVDGAGAREGIVLSQVGADVVINNCLIMNATTAGIYASPNANASITNCTIRNNNYGIFVWRGSAPTISNSVFDGNNYYGAWLVDSAPSFTKCSFVNHQDKAVTAYRETTQPAYFSFNQCFFGNNSIGAEVSSDGIITNSVVTDNFEVGLRIGDLEVRNNTIIKNGIGLHQEIGFSIVRNNIFENNTTFGLEVDALSPLPTLSHSLFYSNTQGDVHIAGSGKVLKGPWEVARELDSSKSLVDQSVGFGTAITGTWDVVQAMDHVVRLRDEQASFTTGALVGQIILLTTSPEKKGVVLGNSSKEVFIATDAAAGVMTNQQYSIPSYRLGSTSAALDRGSVTAAPIRDFEGTARPGADSKVDIGADEASASFEPKLMSFVRDLGAYSASVSLSLHITVKESAPVANSVELWYRKNTDAWALHSTVTNFQNPIAFTASGEGRYSFYTVARNGSTKEDIPPQADATTMVTTGYADNRIYVDGSIGTSGTGGSWATACKTITEALAISESTGIHEIWVKSYTSFYDESLDLHGNLALRGGFSGTETTLSQRPASGRTKLRSSAWQNPTLSVNGAANVLVEGFQLDCYRGSGGTNRKSVQVLDSSNVNFQDCEVTLPSSSSPPLYRGAEIEDSAVKFTRCEFHDGYEGALTRGTAQLTLEDSSFYGGYARGMQLMDDSELRATGVVFRGGGIGFELANRAYADVQNSAFLGVNTAATSYDASHALLKNCVLIGLPASDYGIKAQTESAITVESCFISGFVWGINSGGSSQTRVSRSIITRNTGPGVYLASGTTAVLENTWITQNGGPGIRVDPADVTFTANHCTIANNLGSGVYVLGDWREYDNIAVNINSSIISGNAGSGIEGYNFQTTYNLRTTLFYDNANVDFYFNPTTYEGTNLVILSGATSLHGAADITGAVGCITGDPKFEATLQGSITGLGQVSGSPSPFKSTDLFTIQVAATLTPGKYKGQFLEIPSESNALLYIVNNTANTFTALTVQKPAGLTAGDTYHVKGFRLQNGSAALNRGQRHAAVDLEGEERLGSQNASDIGADEAPVAYSTPQLSPLMYSRAVEAITQVGGVNQSMVRIFYVAAAENGASLKHTQLWYSRNDGSWTKYGNFTSSPIHFTPSEGGGTYKVRTVAENAAGVFEEMTPPSLADISFVVSPVWDGTPVKVDWQSPAYLSDVVPDGKTWATAYRTLNEAYDKVFSSGATEIWVAAGQYATTYYQPSQVAVYGGFAGNETTRNSRDAATNLTVIAGGVEFRDSVNTLLDGFEVHGGVRFEYCDETNVLSACTVSNQGMDGDALVWINDAHPWIKNCKFVTKPDTETGEIGVQFGIAIVGGSAPKIETSVVEATALELVHLQDTSAPLFTSCKLLAKQEDPHNSTVVTACDIGILVAGESEGIFKNCIVSGAASLGVYVTDLANPQFEDCTFSVTGMRPPGTTQTYYGDGVLCDSSATSTFEDCFIIGNRRLGLAVQDFAHVDLANCVVAMNALSRLSPERTGVLLTDSVVATFHNSHISDHKDYGLYAADNSAAELHNTLISGSVDSTADIGLYMDAGADVNARASLLDSNNSVLLAKRYTDEVVQQFTTAAAIAPEFPTWSLVEGAATFRHGVNVSGTWSSAPVYTDQALDGRWLVTLADSSKNFNTLNPDGHLVQVDAVSKEVGLVVGHTQTTLSVVGSFSSAVDPGSSYKLLDYSAANGSRVIDIGDRTIATEKDVLGTTRINGTENMVDIGAYEATNSFAPTGTKVLTIEKSGNGSTSPAPGKYTLINNAITTITATADAGNTFLRWEDSGGATIGTNRTIQIQMTANKTVRAVFKGHLQVIVSKEGSGTVTPGLGVYMVATGESVSFTAIPVVNSQFVHWKDGDSGEPLTTNETLALPINDDRLFVAIFKEEPEECVAPLP